jgi:protein-S-isoprenylcysteine O-methyltransferase Ste14
LTGRARAAVGSLVFFAVAPVVVAGVFPWLIGGWELAGVWWLPLRLVGLLLVLAGGAVLVHSFYRFVTEGIGTPAPVAPTENLVVGGIYRHVRNPMYLSVVTVIVGQGLLFGDVVLLAYVGAVGLAMAGFVRWHEEPVLTERFGGEYDTYRANVPGWLPRLRPFDPSSSN